MTAQGLGSEEAGWWPVAQDRAAGEGPGPWPVRLLGQALVLWHGDEGPVLMDDRCPHRGARLSIGRVCATASGTALQCGYHGWRFAANGRCVGIPADPSFVPPPSHAVARYEARVAHGMVWARLRADEGVAGQAIPVLEGLPARRLIYGPFDVATSAPRAVENFLDTSHFAFVHEGWLGDASHPEVPAHEVTHTADGRPVIERYLAWQPRASASASEGAWVTYRYEVLSPYAALLSKRAEAAGGPQDSYVIWACPQDDEHSRLWFAQYTSDLGTPDDTLRDFQVEIFSQDQPVLESQRPCALPLSGLEMMSAADRLSAAYRRYLKAQAVRTGVC